MVIVILSGKVERRGDIMPGLNPNMGLGRFIADNANIARGELTNYGEPIGPPAPTAQTTAKNAESEQAKEEKGIFENQKLNDLLSKLTSAINANSAAVRDSNNEQSQVSWKDYTDFNKQEAKDLRDWQEYMSNTAHQREMEDLKKAGLNPILTGKYGGASTPAGAMATASQQQMFGAQTSETFDKFVGIAALVGLLIDFIATPQAGDGLIEAISSNKYGVRSSFK